MYAIAGTLLIFTWNGLGHLSIGWRALELSKMKFIDLQPDTQHSQFGIFFALSWKAIIKRCFSPIQTHSLSLALHVEYSERGRKEVGRSFCSQESTKYDNAASALTKITNFSGRHCCYSHYRFTFYQDSLGVFVARLLWFLVRSFVSSRIILDQLPFRPRSAQLYSQVSD